MGKTATLRDAFAHFGTVATNPVWGWSAVSPDHKTVAVTIWEDNLADDGSVDKFGHPQLDQWSRRTGNRDRVKHFKIAQANCNGEFRVVLVRAKDPNAEPRSIAARLPVDDWSMRLVELNERTGEFRAERIR